MGAAATGDRRGKLRAGVRLILWHPIWDRSCRSCETYDYGSDGRLRLDHKGLPRQRTPGVPTPCRKCPKVPEEAKEATAHVGELRKAADDMTDANRTAYARYLEWKAVNRFPDDAVVTWYAGVIRGIEDGFARYQTDRQYAATATMAAVLRVRLEHGR